jgi:parallel beta-helix repeat protein
LGFAGVFLSECSNITVSECNLSSSKIGFMADQCTNCRVLNCIMSENVNNGALVTNSSAVKFINCKSESNGSTGILIEDSIKCLVDSCFAIKNGTSIVDGFGFVFQGCENSQLRKCRSDNNSKSGIFLSLCDEPCEVSDSVTSFNGTYGIETFELIHKFFRNVSNGNTTGAYFNVSPTTTSQTMAGAFDNLDL